MDGKEGGWKLGVGEIEKRGWDKGGASEAANTQLLKLVSAAQT